jgi:hypothetical protein
MLYRISTEGGARERLAEDGSYPSIAGVTIIGDDVYWGDRSQMYVTPLAPFQMNGTLPFGSYAPFDGFNNVGRVSHFMEVRDRVYWADEATVGWISKDRLTCGSVAKSAFHELSLSGGYLIVDSLSDGAWSMAL